MIRKLTALFLALMLILSLCAGMAEEGAADFTGHIIILHTNDSHGRVSDQLGFSKVSLAKKTLEETGATVLLLDAGDALHGLPFATVSRGESVVKLMNAAGYDAMTPGNHDFNYGYERLSELAGQMDFPLLSANVLKEDGSALLDGRAVIEKGNVKFGIFGLTTPETAYKTNPKNVAGLTFTDPVELAKVQVAALEDEECTVIIALMHMGLDESSPVTASMIAQQVEGIDIIVDGHSHTVLADGLWVNDTLIASTGEYIANIGCIDIDPDGNAAATLLTAEDFGPNDTDAALDEMIGQIIASQDSLLNVVVGQSAVDLEGARELVRTGETNLGNLAADAIRTATGADVALTNGGGIRDSIPAGEITKKQLVAVFPFGNYIVTQNLTGAQLLAVLENGVSRYPDADGRFPQVSGLTFMFDGEAEAGARVFNVMVNGEPLQLEKTYLFATNDYIAGAGDEYPLADVPVVNEYSALEEALIAYIATFNEPVAPAKEGRIEMGTKPDTETKPGTEAEPDTETEKTANVD